VEEESQIHIGIVLGATSQVKAFVRQADVLALFGADVVVKYSFHGAKLLIFLRFTMYPVLGNHAELSQFRFAYGNTEVPKGFQLTPYLFRCEYIVYCGKRPEVMLTAPVYWGVEIYFDDSFFLIHSYFL
jgi:hypothetical protein